MVVLLIIVVVVIIFVVHSNNKEKERQERQRRIDAENIRKKYKEGFSAWKSQMIRSSSWYETTDDGVLKHKEDIIQLHNEIIERYKAAARRDEQFEAEQKSFNDKCYALSKEHLPNEGRYHYNVEWYKNKSNGGRSKEQFTVWQFFFDGLCLNQELDYTYSAYYKARFDELPKFKEMTRHWTQPVYDRINNYISAVAKLSSRPLIVALVDTKEGWSQKALMLHLYKIITMGIPNTLVFKLSQIRNTASLSNIPFEHILVIDVYTENYQLINICENLQKAFAPSHAVISYISFLKCFDRDEMLSILERKKEEEKQRLIHEQAESIKQAYPDGYDFWRLDLILEDFNGEIQEQMIIESADKIKQYQREYEEDCQREKEKKEKLEAEYNRIKKKYPIGTEYYEKYKSGNGKDTQDIIVGDEEGVAKYEITYAKYLDLQKKYPLGLPAFEKFNSNGEGNNSSGYTIEETIEHEEEIRQFEQKETSRLKQLRDSLPTKVKNWDTLQDGMHYCYLLRYYPITCEFKATNKEWEDRNTVWNFKNDPAKVSSEEHDEALKWVLQNVKDKLLEAFDRESLKLLTLVCIPASSKMMTERRYKDFSSMLCDETGMDNSYSYINITNDATPKHLGGTGKPTVEFDEDFFKNKNIIIFDDVITSGRSMLRMKLKMEQLGATVIAGISIGKTFHHRPDNQTNISVS